MAQRVKDPLLPQLWCRLQLRSDLTPGPRTSMYSLKKEKKKKRKKNERVRNSGENWKSKDAKRGLDATQFMNQLCGLGEQVGTGGDVWRLGPSKPT